jgi:hypothetical protein
MGVPRERDECTEPAGSHGRGDGFLVLRVSSVEMD